MYSIGYDFVEFHNLGQYGAHQLSSGMVQNDNSHRETPADSCRMATQSVSKRAK